MRDINECTAEVFRRSREKIEKRRRRHRTVIAAFVPLCLCAVITTAAVFSYLQPKKTADYDMAASEEGWYYSSVYTEIEISCENESRRITDKTEIDKIANVLRALDDILSGGGCENAGTEEDGVTESNGSDGESYVVPEGLLSGTPSYGSYPDDIYEAIPNASNTYRISFIGENGEKTVYSLAGCLLICETDGGTAITLTDGDAESLRQIFDATD